VIVMSHPFLMINSTSSNRANSEEAGSLELKYNYHLVFSTYLGGSDVEQARDVFVDDLGFVYIVGGTKSMDFPHTTGPAFNSNRCATIGTSGQFDIFIAKYAPTGALVWSRLLGSPCYDRAYAVEVDDRGFVYVSGRAGEGFPVTGRAFQTNFNGVSVVDSPVYGAQNGFIAKISADGSTVVWASYVGITEAVRDFDLDQNGNLYLNAGNPNTGRVPPATWYTNAFQKTPPGGMDCGVMKVTNDGTRVLWATWLGSPGEDSIAASIRVDRMGYVYASFNTFADGVPTNPKSSINLDVYDRSYNGAMDGFLAKLTNDGSDLVYGTYIGGDEDDYVPSTHDLAVDSLGNAYIAIPTRSRNFPITQGAFDISHWANNETDIGIVKISPTGALLASTFVGGNGADNVDGIYSNEYGEVFISGETDSNNFPTQNVLALPGINYDGSVSHGQMEAFALVLSADFSALKFSSYLGGPENDNGRSAFLGNDGSLYITGSSDGPGWPVMNANQGAFKGGSGSLGIGDAILAKLSPNKIYLMLIFK
jgi:hypothetical protein